MSRTCVRALVLAVLAVVTLLGTTTAVAGKPGDQPGAVTTQSDRAIGNAHHDAQAAIDPLYRWALGYDSRNEAMMRDAFTEDARFVFYLSSGGDPLVFEGRDEVMKLFTDSLAAQNDVRRHVTTNPVVTQLDHETVGITSYLTLLVINSSNAPPELRATGVYTDTVVLQHDGVWRIRERELRLDTPS